MCSLNHTVVSLFPQLITYPLNESGSAISISPLAKYFVSAEHPLFELHKYEPHSETGIHTSVVVVKPSCSRNNSSGRKASASRRDAAEPSLFTCNPGFLSAFIFYASPEFVRTYRDPVFSSRDSAAGCWGGNVTGPGKSGCGSMNWWEASGSRECTSVLLFTRFFFFVGKAVSNCTLHCQWRFLIFQNLLHSSFRVAIIFMKSNNEQEHKIKWGNTFQ